MSNFTLEPVLRHRKLMEENLQKELSVLNKLLLAEQQKLKDYRDERTALVEELEKKQGKGLAVSEVSLYVRFIELLSGNVTKQKETVRIVQEQVEKKREDLIEATKKKKILERLKDKALRTYEQVLRKKEEKFLNEVGINQFNRGV
ncbi:MAG: flagellar export protein FliJ [Thermodesulfobacteriota bacterium]|nr:flagellar export protein FliJ [Thermodesulfobacteriota bacterium]